MAQYETGQVVSTLYCQSEHVTVMFNTELNILDKKVGFRTNRTSPEIINRSQRMCCGDLLIYKKPSTPEISRYLQINWTGTASGLALTWAGDILTTQFVKFR